jgi:hypothetical protein
MKMEPGIAYQILAYQGRAFPGGDYEITAYLYSDRCFDLTGVPVRIRVRKSATISKN